MGAEGAVEVLWRKEIAAAEDKEAARNQRLEEYRKLYGTPYYGASKMIADVVIRPQETRPHLIRTLKLLRNKEKDFPARKHGNMPV